MGFFHMDYSTILTPLHGLIAAWRRQFGRTDVPIPHRNLPNDKDDWQKRGIGAFKPPNQEKIL